MQNTTILTCAVTGNLTQPNQTPHLPITPTQISDSCLEAADAGAAAVHIHVRDPDSGRPSMEVDLYAEVVGTLRKERPDLIINLTTGPGGRFIPSDEDPRVAASGTTLSVPELRVAHIAALRPDICSLDLNTMNSGDDVVINTRKNVSRMARIIRAAGAVPELECFDSGDLVLADRLIEDGVLEGPGLFTFVMGVQYAMPFAAASLAYAKSLIHRDAQWSAFSIGRHAFPAVAQSYLMGGNVRVGLEDTIYLNKGELAKGNRPLVAKARRIVEDLGGTLASSAQARVRWGLRSSNAAAPATADAAAAS